MNSLEQMNQAMEYIENNLLLDVDFSKAAEIAGCSEYHFLRVFSFLAGMPLGEYIRSRKLSNAAERLRAEEIKIADLALELGYESPDAFTKAFHLFHGTAPSKARETDSLIKIFTPMTFQLTIKGGTKMKYRIVEKEAFYVIGFKKRITLIFNGINTQMESVYEKLTPEIIDELKNLSDTEPKGMLNVSVNFSDRTQEGSELDQFIGVASSKSLSERTVENDGNAVYDSLYVKPYTWAVFSVSGKFPDALQDTWARIYSEWLSLSDYELCDGPEILWNESPDITKADYKSEIWIPVVKKIK
ncbi:AraC family transcriptional regulator [Methanimicrococcus sp. OttesenSCG-928-J09]|nr:AraC family transcriptional regulator [Methanimicrococcus sp. OttesenSCG-928-J09]